MKVVSLTCVLASLSSLKSSPPPGRAAFLKKILLFFFSLSFFFLFFLPPFSLFAPWNEPRKNRWRISGRPSRRELPLWKVASLNHPETFKGRDPSIAEFLNVRSGRRDCLRGPRIDFPKYANPLHIFLRVWNKCSRILETFHRFRLIENDGGEKSLL